MSCSICLEPYNKRVKRLQCQFCPAEACTGCHQRVLLGSYEDPACYSCKRGWSPEFMAAFPMSFRGTALRLHRRKVLFEREKTVLPALQIYVEYKKDCERLSKLITDLVAEIGHEYSVTEENKDTMARRWRLSFEENMRMTRLIEDRRHEIIILKENIHLKPDEAEVLTQQLQAARSARDSYKGLKAAAMNVLQVLGPTYQEKRNELRSLQQQLGVAQANYDDRDGVKKARREFIMRCPAEDCRGFLSSAYKCGTCETWACKDCLVCIGKDHNAEHTCNPDTVASAKAIRAETMPCPKCATRIFKSEGCNQMFCIMDSCGTAFDWNTGHIVTGVIHNPHYYEWLRRNGGAVPREAGDIPCGGMPTVWQFVHAMHIDIPNELKGILMETFRNMQELVAERMGNFPARMPQLMNKDDDVAYLMNRLTEDEWKRRLELSEARFNRKKEIGQILQTLVTAGSEMMNRLFEKDKDNTDEFVGWLLDTCIPELDQLRLFGNDALKALAKRDRMAVPQLEECWKWKGARALYKPKKEIV